MPRLRLGLNVLHLIEIRDQPLRDGRTPHRDCSPIPSALVPAFEVAISRQSSRCRRVAELALRPKTLGKLTWIKAAKSQIE